MADCRGGVRGAGADRCTSRGRRAQTANLALKYKQVIMQGAGAAGAAAQSNYGAASVIRRRPDCASCWTSTCCIRRARRATSWSRNASRATARPAGTGSGPRTKPQWRRAVHRMFDPNGRVAGMAHGVPQTTYDRVSKEQAESIIKYLTANFGPGSKPRDLKIDRLVSDEAALSQADVHPVPGAAADPRSVRAEGGLRRSADPVAAFGLGQRRQSWRRLHVGQSLRLDRRCRHADPRSGEAHEGVADRQPSRTSWCSRMACSTCRTASCTSWS